MNAEPTLRQPRNARAVENDHDPNPNRRISVNAVRDLCGGVSAMTIWRWSQDPALDFPKPVYIANRRYWREAEILDWLEARAEGVA